MSDTSLTKGGPRELVLFFIPIALTTFCASFYLFVEKLLLARLSTDLMEAAITASYPCQIFQGFCIAITGMSQVWIGKWYGAKEWKMVGPGTWQFIWFSILSILVTLPLGLLYGAFYFKGTAIEANVWPYYIFLLLLNFLYPLGITLSRFYIGQGKTRLVLAATVGSQAAKLLFAYILIFGWGDWIPSLGLMGGAISTLIAQGGFCLLLFYLFLHSKNAHMHTRDYRFQPQLFAKYTYPGLLRAITAVLTLASWTSITQLLVAKGGEYLLILSIGGIFFLLLPFLTDALCQAEITIISHMLGAKDYSLLNRVQYSGSLLACAIVVTLTIPFLVFPLNVFNLLFPAISLDETSIRLSFLGIWSSFAFFTLTFVPLSFVLAFKDLKFSLCMGIGNWINGFLLMYVAIEFLNMPANQFWLVLSLMHGSTALIYWCRMKWLISRANKGLETAKTA